MTSGRRDRLADYRSTRRRCRPDLRQFERLVANALSELPAEFQTRLDNLAVVVEDWPSAREGGKQHLQDETLLGLYEGTPYGRRGTDYHLATPDRIIIYRGPILALCSSEAEIIHEVRETLLHEVGHFFGLQEHELR